MAKRIPEGVIELVDGLYQVAGYPGHSPVIPNYSGASVYLARGRGRECIMVDSGFKRFTDSIVGLLGQLGVALSDVQMVAYTHSHGDHVESYEHFQQHGATVAIHEAARNASDWGCSPVRADRFFQDGDVLEAAGLKLRVYHTPGHTPDSCCFLTEIAGSRILFAGDMTGWFLAKGGSDYAQMVASVEKVRNLGADLICGGHWLCGGDMDAYWDKLAKSVGEGIFSLVDRFDAKQHYELTAKRFCGQ